MNIELHNDQEDRKSRDKMLRVENEILQLKLQAETGAIIHVDEELPPEIENVFLRQVQSFEEAIRNSRMVTIYELLHYPTFKKEPEINDEELDPELRRLLDLLSGKHFIFSLPEHFDVRKVYKHITEVLFKREIEDVCLPGMIRYFDYFEEFDQEKDQMAGHQD